MSCLRPGDTELMSRKIGLPRKCAWDRLRRLVAQRRGDGGNNDLGFLHRVGGGGRATHPAGIGSPPQVIARGVREKDVPCDHLRRIGIMQPAGDRLPGFAKTDESNS